jgi:lipopolysaccharide/colanic/teichoic acid biosynthesis glycosyltransferase
MNQSKQLKIKRALDVAGSVAIGVVLAPVMAFTAVVVRQQLGSPVIFKQTRYGKGGKPFTIYKFRTMRHNFNDMAQDQERVTAATNLLRKYSLDELPQLWNVLKGDMSLVGPRPHIGPLGPPDHPRYTFLPGITGLHQVNGRDATTTAQRLEADAAYVKEWSLQKDLHILGRTLPVWVKATNYKLGRDYTP